VVADEGGVGALLLQEVAHQLVQQPGGGLGRGAVDAVLLHQLRQLQPELLCLQVLWQLDAKGLLKAAVVRVGVGSSVAR
jgi:hypothetical protein